MVRMSFQASWPKLSHSSLTKSSISWRGPASRMTTLMPLWASSFASVPPPAPEPMMTTTVSSVKSNFAAMDFLQVSCGRGEWLKPRNVIEAAADVTALRSGFALITERRPHLLLIVERHD